MEDGNCGVMRLWRVYLVYATAACTMVFSGCVLGLNEEGQLLINWKQGSLQDPDNSLSNWNASDATPCFWNGVNCTQGSVSAVDFSPFWNLGGPIDTLTFAKFANLTILNVGYTIMNGTFPTDIGYCSKLVYLNLSSTYITGGIPDNIINLQSLQVLDLANAMMGGTVVTRFDKLSELRVLHLAMNQFVGKMPESIISMKKLEELTLSGNNWNETLPSLDFLTAPDLKVLWLGSNLDMFNEVPWPDFSSWTSMEDLQLHGVNFTQGLFPTGVLKMTQLKTLQLERCNIMGTIPYELKNLTQLEVLNLGNNSLIGNIPDIFGSMPNLTLLWIYTNQLTGPLPPSLWQCERLSQIIVFQNGLNGDLGGIANFKGNLTWVDMANNNFTGEIPPSLGNQRQLALLYLWNNSLSGEIPASFGNLLLLANLDLSQNNLSGHIPPELPNLEGLVTFKLYGNQLTGEIPYDLGRKSLNLQYVDLGTNNLEGYLPSYLCWGNNVQFVGLYANRLTGTIPESYGNCSSLDVMRLDNNLLEGIVPAGLWGSENLVRMQLNGNNFSGSIHPNIGKAKSLSILHLENNIFSGFIPPEIGQTSLVKFLANSNKLNGTLTPLLGNLSTLTELTLGANSFSGAIPSNLSNCKELVQLDLSQNHLSNAIPNELVYLYRLSTLDLSENDLTGAIPSGFFGMLSLQMLNVAFNNLSGIIPNQRNGHTFVTVNFTGNPYLCMEGSCGTNSSTNVILTFKKNKIQAWTILVAVIVVVAFVMFLVLVLTFKRWRSNSLQNPQSIHDESSWTLTPFHNKVYVEDEITTLDEDNYIGAGGSGKVYKVTLSDGEIVAVKKLWNVKKDKGSGDYGFETELKTLANIRHQHIVKLFCSCSNRDNNLLVYEYMPNGSLGDLLHGSKSSTLSWEIRYKIAVGAAKGLEYLHHECSPQILHRDIKSNNILVDLEYESYLADFGIAKMIECATSVELSSVAGSLGYIPPVGKIYTEYSFGTRVTEKIDIYSFGVVLLELVTGKRASDPIELLEGTNLVQWVHNRVVASEHLCEILDSKCGMSSRNEMIEVLKIATLCTNSMPKGRPSMHEVVKMLEDVSFKSSMKIDTSMSEGVDRGFHEFNSELSCSNTRQDIEHIK